jgi:hypothetical protein
MSDSWFRGLPIRSDLFSEFDLKMLRMPYPTKKVTKATMPPILIDRGATTNSRKTNTKMAIKYGAAGMAPCSVHL